MDNLDKLKIVLMTDQSISSQFLSEYLLKHQNQDFCVLGIIRQYFLKRKSDQRINMSFGEKLKEIIKDKGFFGALFFFLVGRWLVSPRSPIRRILIKLIPGKVRYFTIEELAKGFNVSILKTNDINDNKCVEFLEKIKPDLGIVCGTGIIKNHIFEIPKFGCINYHNGLLPEYRGCAAVFWQLYYGREMGYTIHTIDAGIDTGKIIKRKIISFKKGYNLWETIAHIKEDMSIDCAKEFIDIIKKLKTTGKLEFKSQNEKSAAFFNFPTPEQKKELEERFKN